MENSASHDDTKQHLPDNKHPNIETVTPDIENIHPLSRQESPENSAEASSDISHTTDTHTQKQETAKKATEQENFISGKSEDITTSENISDDPGAEIETVSP